MIATLLLAPLASIVSVASTVSPAAASTTPTTDLTWGLNADGQLGDGTTTSHDSPVGMYLANGVVMTSIAAGQTHSLAIGSDGNTYAWGSNSDGQLGIGSTQSLPIPVQLSPPPGVTFRAVSAGCSDSLAIGSNGDAYAWGYNAYGELGNGTTATELSPVQVDMPAGVTVKAISAGCLQSLAIGSNGDAYAWGYNAYGEVGNDTTTNELTPVLVKMPTGVTATAIAAGAFHSMAIGSNGDAYAWGYNAYGQLGDNSKVNKKTPVKVKLPTGVTARAIAAGGYHSLAIGSNGATYSWGYNAYGQLGNGTVTSEEKPVVVSMPSAATSISAGVYQSLAIGADGIAFTWGYNADGELGDGNTVSATDPVEVQIPAGFTVSALSSGSSSQSGFAVGSQTATTTTLSAAPTSASQGQIVTMTAVVSPTDGGGTVSFFDQGATLCTVGLVLMGGSYEAQCSTSSLPPGVDSLTASYAGDAGFLSSTSLVVQVTVTGTNPSSTVGAFISDSIPNASSFTQESFYTTVVSEPTWQTDAYFFSNQEGFTNGGAAYIGIQPGDQPPKAFFSYFGSGATNLASTCIVGADNGPGVSCKVPFTFAIGDHYETTVSSTANGSTTTWTGVLTDLTTQSIWIIGSWTIPTSVGLLNPTPEGFTEWFGGAQSSCSALPYARVVNGAPTGVAAGGGSETGTIVSGDDSPLNCSSTETVSPSEEISTTGKPEVSPDGSATVTSSATSTGVTVTPNSPGDLLVASVSTYNGATVTISGGGLTWTNVLNKADTISGDGGLISVWEAREPSTFPAPATAVVSTISGNAGWDQTLDVEAYAGASGIGATAFANGPKTTNPTLTLTPQQTGSWISTAGFDADSTATVTPGSGQTLDGAFQDTTNDAEMWFQHDTTTDGSGQLIPAFTTAGQQVTVADALSPVGVWDLGAVEITPTPQVNLLSESVAEGATNVTATVDPANNYSNVIQGDLLVAYVSTTNTATVTVSSPGMTWTNVLNKADTVAGDGGLVSVWEAVAPAPPPNCTDANPCTIPVQSAISGNGSWSQTLVVGDFDGAEGVGAVGFTNGPATQAPSLGITPEVTGSWIAAVGFDAASETTVTAGSNQALDATTQDTTEDAQMWFQQYDIGTTAGNAISVGDTLSPTGVWDLGAVEIYPQP